ncbi:bifunctional purine biosynthesis protein PurH [Alicyclobacillus contaminans]|nr:bifunctional phosphoribosylaminoimidazolecarboxamide formyltransferase/IMP cyclohydrolase [Alicyclobacillus contaminans]GMA50306.1 bifunctional purine biosynthesis protein PurH [Alicyclobacillus contaminans]
MHTAKWALVSVYDKQGIIPFCEQLVKAGYGILSTGGTATHLQQAGLPVTEVSDYTGFPEMMNGRVKTLHPKVHGGILSLRDDPAHVDSMQTHGIAAIDVVVVNLYPFAETIAKPGVTPTEAIEMIDIGGPSMLRSAAKNHRYCLPVIDPADYGWIGRALAAGEEIPLEQRRLLARKVFAATALYDATIAQYLGGLSESAETEAADASLRWPNPFVVSFVPKQALRYGENPHQAAYFYAEAQPSPASIAGAKQWQGKELSYNNIQDADAALNIVRSLDDLERAAVVAVKHMNPCGVGLGETALAAFEKAYEADPVSIFGGIIAVNRTVDEVLAKRLTTLFLEIVIAPGFTEGALAAFAQKKNVRLLEVDMKAPLWQRDDLLYRRVSGGVLVQQVDVENTPGFEVVTEREPTADEWEALRFGWRIVKHVKSNAIVLATKDQTLGVGAGQMNRVGAAQIAIAQAGDRAAEAVLASDAFFPMRDTVDAAAAAGVRAIIQPGGSIKDKDSIAACNEHGIAMVFTHRRHFLH